VLHFTAGSKAGYEPVTISDYGSQAILCRALAAAYPADGVIAEESATQFMELVSDADRAQVTALVGDVIGEAITEAHIARWLDHGRERDAARQWLIDPVDGTKGYIANRRYSIAIGAVERGTVKAGVLATPGYPTAQGTGRLFYGQAGAAYSEPMHAGAAPGGAARVTVAARQDAGTWLFAESVESAHVRRDRLSAVYDALGLRPEQIVQVDSQDKYAMVACGDADAYIRFGFASGSRHRAWDHAAGTAIVEAAGGRISDVDGSPLDFSTGATLTRNQGMVVTSAAIHEAVLRAIAVG
jgi:3'(2'), 5'-bisphosphate nucleotidase